jgi:hypothetical protein
MKFYGAVIFVLREKCKKKNRLHKKKGFYTLDVFFHNLFLLYFMLFLLSDKNIK